MKKSISIFLTLALLLAALPALGEDITKDETVYILLDASGNIQSTYIVSHMDTPAAGDYTDHGTYSDVSAMLEDVTPTIDGDTITWTLPENPEGFYAVGQVESAQPPYLLSVAYTLDGNETTPETLAGQSGSVVLTLTVTPNEATPTLFQSGYMAQIQLPLSLANAHNIQAPGATSLLVGQTQTLSYMVFSGQEATYTVSFDADHFSMDAITMTVMAMDLSDLLQFEVDGGETDGITALSEGASTLTEGTQQLADGMQTLSTEAAALPTGVGQLSGGIASLNEALAALPEQLTQLEEGSEALSSGVTDYVQGADAALSAVSTLSGALSNVAENGTALSEGFTQLEAGFAPLLASLPEAQRTEIEAQLSALSQSVAEYTQGVSAIATQASTLSQSAATLTQNTETLVSGIASQQSGITQLTSSLGQLPEQTAPLATGAAQLAEGTQALSDAIATMNTATASLAEGQAALSAGIGDALALLGSLSTGEDGETVSFANPTYPARSVQFVYQTEGITPQAEAAAFTPEETGKTLWDRIKALF